MASFIAFIGLILGNLFALNLSYDLGRKFYFIEKVVLSELAAIFFGWMIWNTVTSALQRTRQKFRRVLKCLLGIYLFISICSVFPVVYHRIGSIQHWYGFIIFGIYFQLVICVFFLRGVFIGVRCIARTGLIKLHHRKSFGPDQCTPDFIPSRLGRVSLLVIFIYSVCIGLYGVNQAWKPPQVVEVNITLPKFPPSMNGLRVLQLSDIHLEKSVARETMEAVVKIVDHLKPGRINFWFCFLSVSLPLVKKYFYNGY